MKNSKKIYATAALLGFSLNTLQSYAAVYNFYFNNTEQGDHSQANPSLSVAGDGKVTSTGEKETKTITNTSPQAGDPNLVPPQPQTASPPQEESPEKSKEPATPKPESAPKNTAQVSEFPKSTLPKTSYFRVLTSGMVIAQKAPETNLRGPKNYSYSSRGGSLGLGFFPNKYVGFQFFGGAYEKTKLAKLKLGFVGIESEIIPIRLNIGRIENLVSASFLLGAASMQAKEFMNDINPHVGVRASLNLGEHYSFTGAVRLGLMNHFEYASVDAGLMFRI